MALPPYAYILIVFFGLVILGTIALCLLGCLGVRWCCKLTNKLDNKRQPYAVPPGFSLQPLHNIRVDPPIPPEQTAGVAAENAFLDALPGLPHR